MLKRTCTVLNRKSVAPYEQPTQKQKKKNTVKPVYSGPVYSGHPIYYGYWTTLRKLNCIERSPPLKQMRSGPLQTLKMHDCIILYLCIKVDKQDYDQVMSKLCYVSSKVHGKMNTNEIVKSVNLIMAIEWGELQALDELNIQFSLQETDIYWSPIS